MLSVLTFFYVNFSAFHGDGSVVWLSPTGACVVQRATHENNRVYQLQVPKAALAEIETTLAKLGAESFAVNDRLGIPDEVRVRMGFRHGNGPLRRFEMWEHDLGKQAQQIRTLDEIARQLLALTAKQRPTHEEVPPPAKLEIVRPKAFSPADLDAALK